MAEADTACLPPEADTASANPWIRTDTVPEAWENFERVTHAIKKAAEENLKVTDQKLKSNIYLMKLGNG